MKLRIYGDKAKNIEDGQTFIVKIIDVECWMVVILRVAIL
jgi:hypothetical protein